MDAGRRETTRPDDDAEAPRPATSDRLQLEIALLSGVTSPNGDPTVAGEPTRIVLLAMADADLRDYITQCLEQRADLRVVESRPGDAPLEVARGLGAGLVIADVSAIAGDIPPDRPPLIVTGDELPDALPVSDAARIAFLLQPFNARRLLDAVSRLVDGRAAG
jgi:hypothetical protein